MSVSGPPLEATEEDRILDYIRFVAHEREGGAHFRKRFCFLKKNEMHFNNVYETNEMKCPCATCYSLLSKEKKTKQLKMVHTSPVSSALSSGCDEQAFSVLTQFSGKKELNNERFPRENVS